MNNLIAFLECNSALLLEHNKDLTAKEMSDKIIELIKVYEEWNK